MEQVGDKLIKASEEFYNEAAIQILVNNYNIWIILFSIFYFIIFMVWAKFFFKEAVYKFYYYLVIFLIYSSTFFIYEWIYDIATLFSIIIIVISIFSQKDMFIDLIENIKLQRTETDRFSMVLFFSDYNKNDIENKINNLSIIELTKEDYKLALEKIKRKILKFQKDNEIIIFTILILNLISVILIFFTFYLFFLKSEYFLQ